jgi:Tol biopolymer transport system component
MVCEQEATTMRRAIFNIALAAAVLGCAGRSTPPTIGPTGAASPAPSANSVTPSAPPNSIASLDPSGVPPGRIAYMIVDPDKTERFFTVDSLGEDKHALFETKFCACISWSVDGSKVVTVTETDVGLRYTTMDPDGSNKVIYTPKIETLSLTPPVGSADGQHLAFFGWDDTDPSRLGIWAAKADMTSLHQVTGVPEGVMGIDPMGMSADGSIVYFHGDLGPSSENEFHHAGNAYAIDADGQHLRQLNPPGTKTESTGMGISADGTTLAFMAWQEGSAFEGNALFIVGSRGAAKRVTDWTPGLWGVSWSPAGDLIAVTQVVDGTRVASLIRPDGTDLRPVSASGDIEAFGPVWSPDGTHFLVRRGEQHRNDLWIMDLEGSFIWQVTHDPGSYDVYDWAAIPAS